MLEVVRVIAAMTTRALEDRVVVRVDMAGGAHSASIAMRSGELGVLGVVE